MSADIEDKLSFKTEFAVEMHCQACVQTIKQALSSQPGIEKYDIDLATKSVLVEGKTSPSQIARALKADGRQVIVRGTGSSDSNGPDGAAVCIFESYTPQKAQAEGGKQDVHGIARMVQIGKTVLLDLTIKHDILSAGTASSPIPHINGSSINERKTNTAAIAPSQSDGLAERYGVYIAKSGDISKGAASTGGVLRELGYVQMRKNHVYGDLFSEVKDLNVWDIVGRAMVIAPIEAQQATTTAPRLGHGILAGVIARSAGAWSNDKTVCTCSGQTMWEENRDAKI